MEKEMLKLKQQSSKTKIRLDGIPIVVIPPDLDDDGKVGGTEIVTQKVSSGVMTVQQPTELGETLKELNFDDIQQNTRMSGIDMRARLHYAEITSVLALDALVSLGVVPTKCLAFTRQKKRLSVSLDGKGRDDIVNIVAGKREQEAKAGMNGFGDRMKTFFGFQKPQ